MSSRLGVVGVLVAFAASFGGTGACENDSPAACEGAEECACYPNGTCNADLSCVDDRCVNPSDDGGASSGGSSNSGSGGASGAGAGTSAGGSAAGEGGGGSDGGANATGGRGGVNATGGDGGSDGGVGGSNATGGVGGAPATGGANNGGGGAGGSVSAGTGGAGLAGSGGSGTIGSNRITNGDFSNGDANWNANGATAGHTVTDGVLCGNFLTTDSRIVLGWPEFASDAIAISGSYRFSFKMSLTGSATIIAKVGRAVSPYTPDFQIRVMPTETLTTFSYDFTVDDSQAGIAFEMTGHSPPTTICIDDVVLAPHE